MKKFLLICLPLITACTGPAGTIGYNITTETRPDGTQVVTKSPDMKLTPRPILNIV